MSGVDSVAVVIPPKGILRRGSANLPVQVQEDDEADHLSYTPLPHEKQYYDELFLVASDDKPQELISVNKAWSFLSLSGLPEFHLKVILSTSKSSETSDKLTKSQFYVAVRLVQLQQNNCKVTALDLNQVESLASLKPAFFRGISDVTVPLPWGSKSMNQDSSRSLRRPNYSPSLHELVEEKKDSDLPKSSGGERALSKGKSDKARHNTSRRNMAAPPDNDSALRRKSVESVHQQPQRESVSPQHMMHSKENGAAKPTQQDGSALPCCPTCAERSEQNASLVLRVWEMGMEVDALKDLVKELKAEIDNVREEATQRNALLEQERKILMERHEQMENMKSRRESKRRDLARGNSGRHRGNDDRRSSRKDRDINGRDHRYEESIEKEIVARRHSISSRDEKEGRKQRSRSNPRLTLSSRDGRKDYQRSRSNPRHSFQRSRSNSGRSFSSRDEHECRKKSQKSGSNPIPHTFDDCTAGAQYAPSSQSQLLTEPMPNCGDTTKKQKLKRRNSMKSFSDLLAQDREDSSIDPNRTAKDTGREGKKQNDINAILNGASSWFGRLKKDKEVHKEQKGQNERDDQQSTMDNEEEHQLQRFPKTIITHDQSQVLF